MRGGVGSALKHSHVPSSGKIERGGCIFIEVLSCALQW